MRPHDSARSPHQIAATVSSKDSPPVGNFSGVQIALRNREGACCGWSSVSAFVNSYHILYNMLIYPYVQQKRNLLGRSRRMV